MREAIAAVVKEYRFNPGPMVKALEALYKTHLKKLERKTEEELAQKVCWHRHPAGCGQVVCKACHAAVVDTLTGGDKEMTEDELLRP